LACMRGAGPGVSCRVSAVFHLALDVHSSPDWSPNRLWHLRISL
jgi:hypothetical protein